MGQPVSTPELLDISTGRFWGMAEANVCWERQKLLLWHGGGGNGGEQAGWPR